MAVIINEFEVVVEPPTAPTPEPGVQRSNEGKEPVQPLSPLDMDSIFRQRLERAVRVRAD